MSARGKVKGRGFKLSTKFILVFTAVLTGVFIFSAVMVRLCAKTQLDVYVKNAVYSVRQDIDGGITETVDEVAFMYARMIKSENSELLDLMGSAKTPSTRQAAFKELVTTAGMPARYLLDVGFKDGNGYYSYNGLSAPSEDVFSAAQSAKNRLALAGVKNSCVLLTLYMEDEVTLSRGTFVFYLLENSLSDVYGALNADHAYSFIVRSDGYVLSHDDKNFVGKSLVFDEPVDINQGDSYKVRSMDGVKKIVAVSAMSKLNSDYGFDCSLVTVTDYGFYYDGYAQLIYVLLIVGAGLFAAGVIMAVLRAKRITRPVENLNNTINEVIRTGNRSGRIAKRGDEIYQLEKNYDEMIDSIFTLIKRNKEEMESQRKLELDALQMQINPHFLYNTLDAVVWLAKIKKEPEIENLVVNLAQFFRLSLHRGEKFITVAEEVEIVKHYFEIERARFPERAELKVEAEEKISGYKTLKLLLQPVVENAFKYAFPAGGGTITVRAYEKDGMIYFEVEDDGNGFDVPDDMLKLKKEKESVLTGYGLYNVNERLKLEYGGSCGLEVFSKKGEGTKVTIKIAKRI